MTDEELVVLCKYGNNEYYVVLWEQVLRFVHYKIHQFLRGKKEINSMTHDDLLQESYFGFIEAINSFNSADGTFKALLSKILHNKIINAAFNYPGASGAKMSVVKPLNNALSLDVPLTDDVDSSAWVDTVPDDIDCIEEFLHELWIAELHAALEKALSHIDQDQAAALWRRYSADTPLTPTEQRLANRGLANLRRKRSTFEILQCYIDCLRDNRW